MARTNRTRLAALLRRAAFRITRNPAVFVDKRTLCQEISAHPDDIGARLLKFLEHGPDDDLTWSYAAPTDNWDGHTYDPNGRLGHPPLTA